MTSLLSCARSLRPEGTPSESRPVETPVPVLATTAPAPARPAPAPSPRGGEHVVLSEREREVGALLVEGLTYKEIGARLFISAKTVEHHVARIRHRCGATSRGDLFYRLRLTLERGD